MNARIIGAGRTETTLRGVRVYRARLAMLKWGWWQEPPDEHGRRRKPSPAVAATGEGTAEPRGQATESVAHLSTDASIRLRAEVA